MRYLFRALIVIAAIIMWLVGGKILHNYYREWAKSHPMMYCYNTVFNGIANPSLYLEDGFLYGEKRFVDSLDIHYKQLEDNPNKHSYFSFPIHTMPHDLGVYVLGYDRDSLIADVICFGDFGNQGSYIRGWVLTRHLHENPAPDSINPPRKNVSVWDIKD